MKHRPFERFYLEKVAIGEGCGCAEQAIGMLDMEARSRAIAEKRRLQSPTPRLWHRLLGFLRRTNRTDSEPT